MGNGNPGDRHLPFALPNLPSNREPGTENWRTGNREPLGARCSAALVNVMAVRRIDLLQGTLDLLVLKSLAAGPNHGYGIATRIHHLSEDVLRIEEGSLYPALYRMEEQGLIESEWRTTENNRRAKFYRLTRKGRTAADAELEGWRRLSKAVTRVLRAIEQGA
jgi:PadR family transcriptional regulator